MIDLPLWKVAVPTPLSEALIYQAPLSLTGEPLSLVRGQRVLVPLRSRKVIGVVLGVAEIKDLPDRKNFAIKSILEIDDVFDLLPEHFIKWLEWLSYYYIYPIGFVTALAFPPLQEKKTQIKRKSKKKSVIPEQQIKVHPQLTNEQQTCIDNISEGFGFKVHLVFGVTGSGKTEIYLQLLQRVLNQGKKGIVLVPEISLTPQLIQRFVNRFGDQVAALHSQLTSREKTNQWWDIIEGRKNILIGARSALFCPIKNLGIVIVDEEHEPSYKQDEKLKYHGRDAAVMLGKYSNCPVILGTATPSLESWKNAIEGRYQIQVLKNRVADIVMPTVEIIDLRIEKEFKKERSLEESATFWLSQTLHEQMTKTLEEGNQVALFLNRRGIAQTALCPKCGYTYKCPNCEINLTLHSNSHLVCHYCDYHENLKIKCQDCREGEIVTLGLGTELIERDLAKLFPGRVIARADRDEIQNRSDLEDMIFRMESGEINILIGTQMIAKGLDFPKLKLVGLVLADIGFNIPDFRSTERSFQLITQMSGRSGRHIMKDESPGLVFIQCFNTSHPSVEFAKKHDFLSFAEQELEMRQALGYPPYGKLVSFRIQGPELADVKATSSQLSKRACFLQSKFEHYQEVEILGPSPSAISKLRNQYRYHLLLKCKDFKTANQFARQLMSSEDWILPKVKILVDVDPINLL